MHRVAPRDSLDISGYRIRHISAPKYSLRFRGSLFIGIFDRGTLRRACHGHECTALATNLMFRSQFIEDDEVEITWPMRTIPGTMPNLTMQMSAIFHFFVLVLLEFPQSRNLPVGCFIFTLTDLQQAFALITKFKTAGQFIAPESVRTFYRPLRAIRTEVPNISRVVASEFHSVSPGCIPNPTDFWRTGVSVSWKNIATGKTAKKLYRNAIESAVRRLPSSGGQGSCCAGCRMMSFCGQCGSDSKINRCHLLACA